MLKTNNALFPPKHLLPSVLVAEFYLNPALPVGVLEPPQRVVAATGRRAPAVVTRHDDDGVLQPAFGLEIVHKPTDALVQVHQHLVVFRGDFCRGKRDAGTVDCNQSSLLS